MTQSTPEKELKDSRRSWVYQVDHGEAPSDYSPKVKAALAIYFGALLAGDKPSIKEIAEASGVSKDVLYHCVKGVKNKMRAMLQEGEIFDGFYTNEV